MSEYREIKPHSWITTNAFFYFPKPCLIVKAHRPKKISNPAHFYKYKILGFFGFPVPFEYRSVTERCKHEIKTYKHWLERGYLVPKVYPMPDATFPDAPANCLALEYIDGKDLASILSDPSVKIKVKLNYIGLLFEECSSRHQRVFSDRDRSLIKYDGNFRNIIVRDEKLYHIDFECGRIAETLLKGAAREVTRYIAESIKYAPALKPLIFGEYRRRYKMRKVIERIDGEIGSLTMENLKQLALNIVEASNSPMEFLAQAVRCAEIKDENAVVIPIPVAWEILRRAGVDLAKLKADVNND